MREEVPEPIDVRTANVLLVDDRPENLLALDAVLQSLGTNLVHASSGREALRALLRDDFAVILMDAQMPDMDGFETAELIRQRERTRHVPIIFITAHDKESSAQFRAYEAGAVDFIQKPFVAEILRSKVRVFVDLFLKSEQIQRQAELIHQQEQRRLAEDLEREHMRQLNEELEERVLERTQELVRANEDMEAFCYSVSHDLRAPLRAIMSTAMILLEEMGEELDEEHKDQLFRQSAAAKRLGVLIDDLLQLSRLGRKTMARQEVDLSEIAHEVGQSIVSHRSGPSIEFEIEPGMETSADVGLARILLENLMENAVKYSPDGGIVKVGSKDGVFYVGDNGIGFDMKYAHKLFLPFERLVTDREYPGTGIGLAIVHRIVKRHNGHIWAESKPGKGSTFYFSLDPLHGAPPRLEMI
ncbi:MAG TPA: response regulator [Fimbriimonas sp.]